ncbi:adenylate/guanylate cyclase domain-containing protein [Bradyrhizobium sp. WYCCWR 13023]|uniref:Adenylate/guanylate cyclase domain-containing protein n=1 Tax=Bradyrhizobium zhengyangense TaxID=2911009 RepID=A0A9X1UD56_9BRAD|nr:adenylate/guanylate cyclase domain-containing protein [Bradyrhizobium zhengyangense]MCG2631064.1 adenylate/guanylate cyclase domain-containing protein [Bradyrhizobium zhengyangense]
MTKARYFEVGVDCLEIIAVLLALLLAVYVSIWAGLLMLGVLLLGLVSLICNYDAWIVRRLSTLENPLILPLCRTGFVGRHRRMLRLLPSEPRCRFCMVPFGGLGKVFGIKPSPPNPNYCRSCFEALPTTTHELEVGILFADLRGFTSWSETHSSSDAAELVSRFYARANRVLTADDALVDFIGDQIMAIYLVDMPSLGARTADIMVAATRRLIHAEEKGTEPLPVGIGIHMGKAQVGSLATGGSKNFTAIGDVVNTAARLQSAAKANEILISETVYDALSGKKPQANRTTLELKGKAERLMAFILR